MKYQGMPTDTAAVSESLEDLPAGIHRRITQRCRSHVAEANSIRIHDDYYVLPSYKQGYLNQHPTSNCRPPKFDHH